MRTHALAGCGLALLLFPSLSFGQVGLRDSIFRAQDSYQQGRLMGEGDASGLLGVLGNLIPDEGGTFNMTGALLSGAFGLLGSAKAMREHAKEEMEQEQYFLSQYLGTQTQPGYYPGAQGYPPGAQGYYGAPQYGAPPFPQHNMGYPGAAPSATYPQLQPGYPAPQPEVRRAIAVQPDPSAVKKARAAAAEQRAKADEAKKKAQLGELSESLSGIFAAEFEATAQPTPAPGEAGENVRLDPTQPLP